MALKYLLLLLCIPFSVYAVSWNSTQQIYKHIKYANGIMFMPPLCYNKDKSINAGVNASCLYVNQGMLNHTSNKHEMALIIGHEIAHRLLWARQSAHAKELAADKLGAKLAAKAGYNICRGKNIFKKFHMKASKSHPHPLERYHQLKTLYRC